MAETVADPKTFMFGGKKRSGSVTDDLGQDDHLAAVTKKKALGVVPFGFHHMDDPAAALANSRHEFGEHGGVNMSIEASATFTVMEPETMRRMFSGELGADRDFFIYSRHFNPTVLNLSRQMAALEGTEAAYCTSSAHDKGVKVVVDNTFAPMVLSPARLGADVVVHSISKYVSGGADIIAGAVCGPASLVNSMMDLHQGALMLLGPTMNAKVAFELSERIPHLSLRVKEHCNRALVYATRMKNLGLKVIYPGLEEHPQHKLLKSMANKDYGYGGILCLDMETEERANRLMYHLQNYTQFGLMAVSLGYYETLMSCSGSSTSSEMNTEEKELAGISPGLVRMSIGYSGTLEQRWSQFEKALGRMQQDTGLFNKI
ncbi:hypothetical protein AQUCO_01300022v1 [Aquilegia coerulea]|uniref:Methionine gamma-lyase n=1 Tax=Aquilegia coerulea TaxID=218851 RepID=A0A2G5DZ53_AQUCA|nr:hypothetical protein AQUCO_01300022v1 [Aquilegia coerulea]